MIGEPGGGVEKLGVAMRGERGFPVVLFQDAYGAECSLQMSSAVGEYPDSYERPGTSFVWLGVWDVRPQIMAKHAQRLGVKTKETSGWVPYPLPEEVLLTTGMHLNREQVKGLIDRLQHWLDGKGEWK